MSWMKRTALAALFVLPLSALAVDPRAHEPSVDEIALHVAERLDLGDELAMDVAERMVEARAEGATLKERIRAEAQVLEAAVASGNEKTMKSSMKELERIHEQGPAIKARLSKDLASMLTVEQQALMALMHLEHMERKGEVMRRVQQRMELERGL